MKILLVEDDQPLANLLQTLLVHQQHQVDVARDGQEGWEFVEAFPYDLVLLDMLLPRLDGIGFCQRLRSKHPTLAHPNQNTPVLLMTAVDTVTNKVLGLDAGADDYVIKPLNFEELQARIRALERRGRVERSPTLEWQGLQLHPKHGTVTYGGQPLPLTSKEYQILELLLRHPDQRFTQSRLIAHLWPSEETPTDNAVRAQIKSLRRKLKQVGLPDVIQTTYKMGYHLSQVQPQELAPSPPAPPALALPAYLRELWQDCRDSYLERVAVLEQATAALAQGQLTTELHHQAEREAHTLVGSLGSFGLEAASQISRQIQQLLKLESGADTVTARRLADLIGELKQALPTATVAASVSPQNGPVISVNPPGLPTLLIVDDDADLAHLLALEAAPWGIETAIAADLPQARTLMQQHLPDVILLDLSLAESGENGLELLAELQQAQPGIPVLVFTAGDSLTDRVQAARLGCRGFFQKPIAAHQVLTMVNQTWQQSRPVAAKLLIVDDDLRLLHLLQQTLEPAGYQLTLLERIDQFWEVLERTAPDLVLLDVALESCALEAAAPCLEVTGLDLCQVMRNDPQWNRLPILLLSACTDSQTMQQGFEAGADDFLLKPIDPIELLTRVRKRLEQGQLRQQTEQDSLTGVSNRRKSAQQITRLIRLAQRQHQPLSLAVLDLDHFKRVNDQYGHEMGDRVLRYFGSLLQQSFRQEDVVGRWGGEEFVVGLYGTSKARAIQRLSAVLQHLYQECFIVSNGRTLQVSFSGGVAELGSDGTDLQALYQAADAALYQAKTAGRSRILAAGGTP